MDQHNLESPEHQLDQQYHIASLDQHHRASSEHKLSHGRHRSTDRHRVLHQGKLQLLCELCLNRTSTPAELKTEITRQLKGVQTLMIAERQPQTNPAAGSTDSTRDDRATCDIHGLRIHPHVNLRLPLLPKQRAHQHPGQNEDTALHNHHNADPDCAINAGGGDDDIQLRDEERRQWSTLAIS